MAQSRTEPFQREFARGVQLQQQGDLKAARAAYEAALRISPQRVDALSNLGLVYGRLGEFELAIQTFQKALSVDAKQTVVRFNLGLTYFAAQQYEDARREFAALRVVQPRNTAVCRMLGLALLKTGRLSDGIRELQAIQPSQPGDVELACTLASAYIKARRPEEARALVEGPLGRSDTAEAHMISGSYYISVQKYPDALAHLRRAYELNPDLPEIQSTLADAYAYNGNQDLAAKMFAAQLRRNPMDFTSNLLLGWLYLLAHEVDKASIYLGRARQIRPDDPDLLFQLAWMARAQDRQQEAADLLEKVVAQRPAYKPAHVLLAQAYNRLKRKQDAMREQAIVKRLTQEEQARPPAPRDR